MHKIIVSGASALAVAVVGTGLYIAGPASAGSSAKNVSAASSPSAKADQGKQQKHRAKRLFGRGVHGQATVRTKAGFAQVSWQRGQVTAKTGNSITVRSLDGTTWQWQTDAKTRVRKNGQKSALGKLAVKDFVVIAGRDGANKRHEAQRVIVPKKTPAKATQSPAPAQS